MLSINTKQNSKPVEIDGVRYNVRKPGAGESLTMQKLGRELAKQDGKKLSEAEQLDIENKTARILDICLGLFDSKTKKDREYLQTLEAEILMDIINQVFNQDESKT